MPEVKSDTTIINNNSTDLFNFLADFRNFEKLMPEQVENWEATEEKCSFSITGLAEVEMRIEEKLPDKQIVMVSEGQTPYPFKLQCDLSRMNENQTEVVISIDAKMNPMLAMMAERPLRNLVQIMAQKLKEIKG